MKELDIEKWERKGIYDVFRHLDFPFYHVAFRVDVTNLKRFTKVHGLSFYYSLVYLVGKRQPTPLSAFVFASSTAKYTMLERLYQVLHSLKKEAKRFR